MTSQLTKTEAETLAVMLTSAGRRMSRTRIDGRYIWHAVTSDNDPWLDMYHGFYDVTFGLGVYI